MILSLFEAGAVLCVVFEVVRRVDVNVFMAGAGNREERLFCRLEV